ELGVGRDEPERIAPGGDQHLEVLQQVGDAKVADPRLAGAEHRSLAPDGQVSIGELEAVGRGDERGESLLSLLAGRVGDDETGSPMGAAAHTPPQLVELAETE